MRTPLTTAFPSFSFPSPRRPAFIAWSGAPRPDLAVGACVFALVVVVALVAAPLPTERRCIVKAIRRERRANLQAGAVEAGSGWDEAVPREDGNLAGTAWLKGKI